ncbi:MAG: hypothetical protein A3C07_03935 [Candidatus Sungbacteria bacterium RIFCSPHIGHO2_02_FULL_47_11]|uniref:Uncharacterized protein n=1 Tax=Candidatus Sungbacteria bacterium RIFCSPHIGHO2_02_FULL_47_11 TaxID=1802270 RepID=A0A1G2KJE2_9BACT|nr:MAG: hypothetical protein A3C07_03935 [Candidatus Sungbacteria bacterium RIFCSPHIGHO2_02_FULL_47_11]
MRSNAISLLFLLRWMSVLLTSFQLAGIVWSMAKSGLPKSVRRFLRKEKSRLRRDILNLEEAEKKVQELVSKIFERHKKSRVASAGEAV